MTGQRHPVIREVRLRNARIGPAHLEEDDPEPDGGTCPLCPRFVHVHVPGRRWAKSEPKRVEETDWHALLHDKCANCPESTPQWRPSLCSFCRHLRPLHLLTCVPGLFSVQVHFYDSEVPEGHITCDFCRFACSIHTGSVTINLISTSIQQLAKAAHREHAHRKEVRSEDWFDFLSAERLNTGPIVSGEIMAPGSQPVELEDWQWRHLEKGLETCWAHHELCGDSFGDRRMERRNRTLHDLCRASRGDESFAHFRVIDLFENRVVDAPQDCRYVALSYVWGQASHQWLQATRSSIRNLGEIGSLATGCVANTIVDAMELCRKLNLRYLWADQLCIVQDDEADVEDQVNGMAQIFSSAYFVLIAADGNYMGCGLPGISKPCKTWNISGLQLKACSSKLLLDATWESTWASRGWTYQEGVLCRRNLYSTAFGLRFVCETEGLDADYLGQWTRAARDVDRRRTLLLQMHRLAENKYGAYQRHLSSYRRRTLGNDSDLCNAFTGILESLYGKGSSSFGLPHQDFDKALLWLPIGQSPGQILRYLDTATPTWSWSSISGQIHPSFLRGRSFCGTVAPWFRLAANRLERIDASSMSFTGPPGPFFMALAWSAGCIEAEYPLKRYEKTALSSLANDSRKRWPYYADFYKDAFDGTQVEVGKLAFAGSHGWLVTRTQSAIFTLSIMAETDQNKNLLIHDEEHNPAGLLYGNDPRVSSVLLPPIFENKDSGFEFIALSIFDLRENKTWPLYAGHRPSELDTDHPYLRSEGLLNYPNLRGEAVPGQPAVAVMLIARGEKNVATRISLGWILLSKWEKAKRNFETIVLE